MERRPASGPSSGGPPGDGHHAQHGRITDWVPAGFVRCGVRRMEAVFRWAAAAGLTMPARRYWSLAQQFRPSCRWSAVAHPMTARLDVGWARADQAVAAGTLEQVTDGEAASITPQQRRPTGRRPPCATRPHHGLDAGRVRPMRRPSDGGRVPVGRRCRVDDAGSAVLVACAAIPAVLSPVRCAHPMTARLDVGWATADQAVTAGTLEQVTDGQAASTTPRQRRPTGRRSPRAPRSHHGLGAGRVRPMRRPSDGGRVPVGRRCRVDDAGSAVLVACAAIPAVLSLVRCGPPYDGPTGRRVGQSGPGSYGGHPRTSHRWRGGQLHAAAAAAHRETVTMRNTAASRIGCRPGSSDAASVRWRPCSGGPPLPG